jgi:hypothetical protein
VSVIRCRSRPQISRMSFVFPYTEGNAPERRCVDREGGMQFSRILCVCKHVAGPSEVDSSDNDEVVVIHRMVVILPKLDPRLVILAHVLPECVGT